MTPESAMQRFLYADGKPVRKTKAPLTKLQRLVHDAYLAHDTVQAAADSIPMPSQHFTAHLSLVRSKGYL